MGAIDRYVSDPREGVEGADFILLATPVDTYERHLQEWSTYLKPGAIVSDVGSVKGELVMRAEALIPPAVSFVGAHPIAGKEKTGVAAGSETLFAGARCILTPTAKTDPDALRIGSCPVGARRVGRAGNGPLSSRQNSRRSQPSSARSGVCIDDGACGCA